MDERMNIHIYIYIYTHTHTGHIINIDMGCISENGSI